MYKLVEGTVEFDILCGVPYAALHLATVSLYWFPGISLIRSYPLCSFNLHIRVCVRACV